MTLTTVTVTGYANDENNVPALGAYIKAQLTSPSSDGNTIIPARGATMPCNADGSFAIPVVPNDLLTNPSGTVYTFQMFVNGQPVGVPIVAQVLQNMAPSVKLASLATLATLPSTSASTIANLTAQVSAAAAAAPSVDQDFTRFTASALPKLRNAWAMCAIGQGSCRIACIGDSTTAGIYTDSIGTTGGTTNQGGAGSYPTRLAAKLTAAGYPAVQAFALPPHSGNADSRWAFGSNWVSPSGIGAGLNACLQSNGTGSAATLTPGTPWDTATIWYYSDSNCGTASVQATGGTAGSLTAQASSSIYTTTVKAATISASNVLSLTCTSGTVFVLGVEYWSSATANSTIRILNLGVGGSKATDWASIVPATYLRGGTFIQYVRANAGIVSLGVNDVGAATTVPNIVAAIQGVVSNVQVQGDAILMSAVPHPTVTDVDNVNASLLAQTNGIAAGLPYINLQNRWGNNLQAQGMSYEGTHPNALGADDMAATAAKALLSIFR